MSFNKKKGNLWFAVATKIKRTEPLMQAAKYLLKKSSGRFLDVRLDPTNQCNLRCRMCYFSLQRKRREKPLFMPLPLFKKISEDVFPKAIFTTLSCGAEPLVHPEFDSMLEIARPYSYYLKFSTNGLLLDEKLSELCVKLPVNEVIFSIDSPNKKTYESIRKGASFEKLVENIEKLDEVKEREDSPHPFVTFNLVLMKSNIGQLAEFVRFAKELNVNRVCWHHMRVFSGLGTEEESLLNYKGLADKKIAGASALAKKLGLDVSMPKLFSEPELDGRTLCDRPWSFLNIWPTGEVLPCDSWHGQAPLGDLSKSSFEEIWNSKPYKELRESIKSGDKLRDCCANCRLFSKSIPKGLHEGIDYRFKSKASA